MRRVRNALVARLHPVQQPVQALDDAGGGGALVQHHANVFGVKAAFLQYRAHQEHVVDAAFAPVGGIGVVVDADQQRAPYRGAGVEMGEVVARSVVEHVIGDVEAGTDFLEIVRRQTNARSQHMIVRVEQVKPFVRTERNKGFALDRCRISEEGVVTDQRPQAMRAHYAVAARLHFFQYPIARRRAQFLVAHPLRDHARRPAYLVRHFEQPALAREQIADAMHHTARQYIGKRGGISQRIQRRLVEQVVVLEKIARYNEIRIPCLQPVGNGLTP